MSEKPIFDSQAQDRFNQRAIKRQKRTGLSFLLDRAIKDSASRLCDISRCFKHALIIGPFDIRKALSDNLPRDKRPLRMDWIYKIPNSAQDRQGTEADVIIQNNDNSYDLIINLLNLQSENNLGRVLKAMRQSLKADGLFISALVGGESLTQLRQSLYQVDQLFFGGAAPRVIPMLDYTQGANMLSAMGLALPVIDMDKFTVHYGHITQLFEDLRDIGFSNSLSARHKSYLPKAYKAHIQHIYGQNFARQDGKLICQFEILWLSGWAPHASQQKPLKPGSAKMRLADALNSATDS